MAHHKRRRAKHQRGGCLMCKPHKRTGEEKPQHECLAESEVAAKVRRDRRWWARPLPWRKVAETQCNGCGAAIHGDPVTTGWFTVYRHGAGHIACTCGGRFCSYNCKTVHDLEYGDRSRW